MTYATGQLIQASDYNSFANQINTYWGGGSGDSGYGQGSTLSGVSAGATVSASEWSNAVSRLNSMRLHQSNANTALTAPSAGQTISAANDFQGWINVIAGNRLANAHGHYYNGGSSTNFLTNGTGFTGERNLSMWVYFGGAAQMRYFFNAGGLVRWSAINSNLFGNNRSLAFDAASADTYIDIYAQDSTYIGPVTSGVSRGFYDLGTGYTQLYYKQVGSGYGGGYVEYWARLNAAAGSSTAIELLVKWNDNGNADGFDDVVSGTARIDVWAYASNTPYLSRSWGGNSIGNAVTA